MNSALSSFRLIIVNDSAQEAQRLSSMFHNAGKPCRAQHVFNEESLDKLLQDQSWDLVIVHDNCESLPPSVVIRNIRKFEKNIAVILLTDEISGPSIVDGMKLGACDVAQLDDDQHLLLIVNRELENRQERKLTKSVQLRLKEVERRNQKLLDSSRDGIAYIQDGMYLYANDSLAEILGHDSRDDIEFMPVMDTIDESDHQKVKQALKACSLQQNTNDEPLHFTALSPEGKKTSITAELFLGEHEGESCIQLMCYAKLETQEIIEAELQSIKYHDPTTDLYNRAYLVDAIEAAVNETTEKATKKSFIYIDIDRFSKRVKSVVSITESDQALKKVAAMIKEHYQEDDTIARISDHAFGIISDEENPEKLLEFSGALCEKVSENLIEVGNKTLQLTLSIGICLIDEMTVDYHSVVNHAIQAADILRKNNDGNGSNIYQKDAQEGTILASSVKKALADGDFKLLFQPILSLRGEDTERYEVLLRMIIDNQDISPTQFFKIAEGLNMDKKIDRWVILESIKYLRKNINEKKQTQQFINLSNASLCDNSLLPWLKVAIEAAKIDTSTLVFQAKERDILQHLSAVKKFTQDAKAMGIDFCITNFGCNSTDEPLATLEHIDALYIKIDGSLSLELQENPDNSKTLEGLVTGLHEKKKITTIPLIEKASILSKLWQLGVHCIQGNYLQPPSAAMDYEFSNEG